MKFDIKWFLDLFSIVLPAIGLTVSISIISLILTVIISIVISVIRYYKMPVLNRFFGGFITFFRATPLVAQLFMLYFGLPCIFPSLKDMTAFQATVISLTLNTSAFMAENFRAALESVETGQLEACYSIGMNNTQTMMKVILPQAFTVALPSIGNHFIGIIKGSALGFTVGLTDIMAKAKIEAALSLRFFEAYLCVTIIYLVLVIFVEKLQKIMEKKLQSKYSY